MSEQSAPHTPQSKDRAALALSSAGHFFTHYFEPAFYVAAVYMPVALGLPFEEVLPLIFIGRLLFGLLAPAAGWLGDHWSMTKMMLIYFVGVAASSLAVGLSQSPAQMAVALGFLGGFASIYHPVGIAWLSKSSRNRGRNMGINGAFGNIGPGVAAIVTGVLIDHLSWRWAFIVPGGLMMVLAAVYAFAMAAGYVDDVHPEADRAQNEDKQTDARRVYLILLVTVLLTGIIFTGTQATLPKLFEQSFADTLLLGTLDMTSASSIAQALMIVYFASGGFQILAGWLSDHYSMKRVYLAAIALQVPTLVATVYLTGLPMILMAMIMVSANTGAQAPENNLIARYTPLKWRSTMFGMKFILSFGVAALTIPIAAWLHKNTGEFGTLYLCMAVCAVLMLLAAAVLPSDRGAAKRAT